eukprot:SM000061S19244  [mRNA]  locus=s61:303265:305717:- [translate_table: standard]
MATPEGWRDHAQSSPAGDPAYRTRALLIANSTLYGGTYFGHCGDAIAAFLGAGGVRRVLFVPYALHDYDKYFGNPGAIQYDDRGQPIDHTGRPKARLAELGFDCTSIHHAPDPVKAVEDAEALFIGGGNTFNLLRKLHSFPGLIDTLRTRVVAGDLLFMSSSCGSTCAGPTISASICMPICPIPSFEGLNIVPFNISPHYQEPEPKAKLKELGFNVSMEENREQRIRQYTDHEDWAVPVVGLREGTLLEVNGAHRSIRLLGGKSARVFWPKREPEEFQPGARMDILLKMNDMDHR